MQILLKTRYNGKLMIDFYQTLYVTIGIALWAILFLSLSNIIREKITIITIFLFVCRMAAHVMYIFAVLLMNKSI